MTAVADAPVPLRIDFVSDVVCPWCAIGLASLEQAITRLKDVVAVELHVQPFELNPGLGPEGEEIATHLAAKYGLSAAQLEENQARLRERATAVGVVFGERRRIHDTFDAHRLLDWAGHEDGGARQLPLKRALLRAYFEDGADVSDHAVLADTAVSAGLDRDRAVAVLAGDEYADGVRAAAEFFRTLGITGVPAVIVERRHLISGGQPVEVFERALREIAASKRGGAGRS